jgi:hypothetical protein
VPPPPKKKLPHFFLRIQKNSGDSNNEYFSTLLGKKGCRNKLLFVHVVMSSSDTGFGLIIEFIGFLSYK